MASPSRVGSKSGGGARRGLRVGLAAAGAGGGVAGRPFAVGPGPLRSDARRRRSEERPTGHPTGRVGFRRPAAEERWAGLADRQRRVRAAGSDARVGRRAGRRGGAVGSRAGGLDGGVAGRI